MALSHETFNEQVESFVSDVASALAALQSNDPVVDAEYAASDGDRLRAAVEAKVELHPTAAHGDSLAELGVIYKLCVDSFSDYLAVEHSSFVFKAKVASAITAGTRHSAQHGVAALADGWRPLPAMPRRRRRIFDT